MWKCQRLITCCPATFCCAEELYGSGHSPPCLYVEVATLTIHSI